MMQRTLLATLGIVFLIGCGGGSAAAPKAPRYHYDEVHIAQFSLAEKESVLNAQNEYQRSRAELMKAEAEYKETKTKLAVTKNERKQALLAEQSAAQEKKAANDSGDMNRINRATRNQRVSELSRRASDDKVAYTKAHRKYLKKWIRYRQEEAYFREARYEYAKAKLGQAKNIAPKGVKYERFKKQSDDHSRRTQKAKLTADKLMQKATASKKLWKGRLKEAEKAKGIPKAPTPKTAPAKAAPKPATKAS